MLVCPVDGFLWEQHRGEAMELWDLKISKQCEEWKRMVLMVGILRALSTSFFFNVFRPCR